MPKRQKNQPNTRAYIQKHKKTAKHSKGFDTGVTDSHLSCALLIR